MSLTRVLEAVLAGVVLMALTAALPVIGPRVQALFWAGTHTSVSSLSVLGQASVWFAVVVESVAGAALLAWGMARGDGSNTLTTSVKLLVLFFGYLALIVAMDCVLAGAIA